jgi:hypothetical protein
MAGIGTSTLIVDPSRGADAATLPTPEKTADIVQPMALHASIVDRALQILRESILFEAPILVIGCGNSSTPLPTLNWHILSLT